MDDSRLLILKVLSSGPVDIAFAILCGAISIALWAPPLSGHAARMLVRTIAVAAAGFALFLPVQLYVLTLSMTGASGWSVPLSDMRAVLLESHAGQMLIPQFALALILLLLGRVRSKYRYWLQTAVLLGVLLLRSQSGHASADGVWSLRTGLEAVHLLSTALWSGAVMVAGLLLAPVTPEPANLERLMKPVSLQSLAAVCGIAVSGAAMAWIGLGGHAGLFIATSWGKLLLVKLCFVAAALALGGINRGLLKKPLNQSPTGTKRLRTSLQIESVFMITILFLSAWLANLPPAT